MGTGRRGKVWGGDGLGWEGVGWSGGWSRKIYVVVTVKMRVGRGYSELCGEGTWDKEKSTEM